MRVLVAVPLALIALALAPRPAGAPGEQASATIALPGLSAPVRIVTDRSGIPHLRAANLPDLYLAWGYVDARDRLWQLQHDRRAGRGTLSGWLGNAALRADGGAQLFEFGERADRVWERERRDPAVRMPLERYAAGVNAWIARCRSGAEPWPRELARLGRTADDWRPADSIVLLFGMGVTLDLDLPELRERDAIERYGVAWFVDRRRFENRWIYDTVPDGAGPAPARTPRAGRRARRAAAAPADAAVAARGPAPGDPLRLPPWIEPYAGRHDPEGASRASNVFAVGARRSASGFPLLANDPHLSLAVPSPFHLIHVTVPGQVDAVGAAVPGLPTIVSGRSARCAWGVTALSADVVDAYADTLSQDGRSVRWRGGWSRIRSAPFRMSYRLANVPLPLLGQVRRYGPHGPIVVLDKKRRVAYGVRWTALEDDRVRLGRLLGIERSGSAGEIAERWRTLVTPCLNIVAADRGGDVLYQGCGLVPRRDFAYAPGPLPGDGRHEWSGFVPPQQMPAWHAPPAGFVVNANNRPRAADRWPRYDWVNDRALRIAERLGGDTRVTLADLRSVQNDVFARAGARFVPRLLACADSVPERLTPRMRAALDTLRRWDGRALRDRVAPTLFRAWYGAYLRRSRLEGTPGLSLAALEGRAPEALRAPGGETPERAALAVVAALDTALTRLTTMLGPDPSGWRWGRAHRARFGHALAGIVDDGGTPWEPPLTAVDGDASSPAVGSSRLPWNGEVVAGPVFRHLVDLAVAESSLVVIPPSNGPAPSPLLARWANHGYVPLYLAWPRVEATRASVTTLAPGR